MKQRPYSPNRIILAMDSHALNYAQQCSKKYWFAHVEHLKSRKTRVAFRTGTFIHDMIHRVTRLRLAVAKGRFQKPGSKPVTDATLLQIAFKRIALNKNFEPEEKLFHQSKFMEFYSMIKVNYSWLKPMGSEVGFSKIIYEDRDVCFIYEGRVDHIARSEPANQLHWVDYKSQSREYALYSNPNQFLGYSWVLDTNIGFLQYYGLQKGAANSGPAAMEKERKKFFKLEPLYHSPELIEQWKRETIKTFRTVASLIPFGENAFERNRSACNAGYMGLCQYIKICDNAFAPDPVIAGIKRMLFREEEWHPWRIKSEEEEEKDNE